MRSTVPLLALAALALAGCAVNEGPRGPGGDGEAQADDFAWGAPVVLGVPPLTDEAGAYLEEALVAVTPDGRVLLACFHGRFDRFSPAYASLDGGATWRELDLPAQAGVSGDCAVAFLADGSWVVLGSTVVGATVLVSRDAGATWSVNPLSARPGDGWADRPWLAGVGNEIWLSYMPAYNLPGRVAFTKSADHGATWTDPVPVGGLAAERSTVNHGTFAQGDGEVCLPMARSTAVLATLGSAAVLEVACSADGGASWSVDLVDDAASLVLDWPALAITQSGHRVAAATVQDGAGQRIQAWTRAPGGDWSSPMVLHDQPDGYPSWPFLDGGAGSNVTWAVSTGLADGSEDLWAGRLDAATGTLQQWRMASGQFEFASVEHDAQGTAYLAWSTWHERVVVKGASA